MACINSNGMHPGDTTDWMYKQFWLWMVDIVD